MTKRSTWKDKKCHHGKQVEVRYQLDAVACEQDGCLSETMERANWVALEKYDRLVHALAEISLLSDHQGEVLRISKLALADHMARHEATR